MNPEQPAHRGRKPIKDGEPTVTLSIRVTSSQRAKLAVLGGAEWVRRQIDRAKANASQPRSRLQATPAAAYCQ